MLNGVIRKKYSLFIIIISLILILLCKKLATLPKDTKTISTWHPSFLYTSAKADKIENAAQRIAEDIDAKLRNLDY